MTSTETITIRTVGDIEQELVAAAEDLSRAYGQFWTADEHRWQGVAAQNLAEKATVVQALCAELVEAQS